MLNRDSTGSCTSDTHTVHNHTHSHHIEQRTYVIALVLRVETTMMVVFESVLVEPQPPLSLSQVSLSREN